MFPRIIRGMALILLSLLVLSPAWAEGEAQLQLYEQKIKAGLVYNFLKYTTWPQTSLGQDNQLQVCLLGNDSINKYLTPLQGKTAQQTTIIVRKISQAAEARDCNTVFIASDSEDAVPELLQAIAGKHILTISDIKRFSAQGGMVELVKEGQKINLYVNTKAVNGAGLDIQSRMLKLAKLVPG